MKWSTHVQLLYFSRSDKSNACCIIQCSLRFQTCMSDIADFKDGCPFERSSKSNSSNWFFKEKSLLTCIHKWLQKVRQCKLLYFYKLLNTFYLLVYVNRTWTTPLYLRRTIKRAVIFKSSTSLIQTWKHKLRHGVSGRHVPLFLPNFNPFYWKKKAWYDNNALLFDNHRIYSYATWTYLWNKSVIDIHEIDPWESWCT